MDTLTKAEQMKKSDLDNTFRLQCMDLKTQAAGALAADTAAVLADVVLKGYLEACGQRETLLRYNLHTAAKLLQLTPQTFRTRHPQWPELMAKHLP